MQGLSPATRRAVWALLALALCVRLAFVAATPSYTPVHDDHDYDRLACAIVGGGGYRDAGPPTPPGTCVTPDTISRPTAYRPPAYPFALAAVYAVAAPLHLDRWTAARVAQAFVGTLVAGLIGLVAGLIWGRAVGLAALALAAVHLPFAMVGASLVSETLFGAFEVGAIACALQAGRSARPWRWVRGHRRAHRPGLADPLQRRAPAAAAGHRGVDGPAAARPRAAALAVAALLAAAALTISPWTVRNARVLHGFVPVATEVGPTLAGTYNDVSRLDPVDPGAWWLPGQVPAIRAASARTRGEPAATPR